MRKPSAGIGIDMVSIPRMRRVLREKRGRFMANTFTKKERAYCASYKDAAPHFAGTFAAKEAVRKATGMYLPFSHIEIRRTKEKKPGVWLKGRRSPILVSITHTDDVACAVALQT